MGGVNEIRSAFLGYFEKNGHTAVASSPLVPRNDPTLMFVNAGMVQFKNVFTGLETRDYVRAATSQKCVRAGGKHNDLDNVGYTARHHTFFEMLGNFSFGNYFKENAIELAWNLLTREFDLPREKLLVTVYHTDDQAFDLWKKIAGLPDDKIIRIPTHDNFWSMGETGPCGPCSEIFFDHGEGIFGGPPGTADEDGDRFIEIWNLVFMQYEQVTVNERVDLPKPSIDTGMGLERIAAVLQGQHDNYEIDLFRALIRAGEEATGVVATGNHKASHRIIADHLRTSCFLIADGVLPSNEGRGYVLRRIMRRAMRHGSLLGAKEPLLWKLVTALITQMGAAYPELVRAESLITETLRLEEFKFRKTLSRGIDLLSADTVDMRKGDVLAGETAFKLYDTYGFPLDLTQDALRQRGIEVDTDGFDAAMGRQKAEARASWSGSGDAADDRIWFELKDEYGPTEFLGYDTEIAEAIILAIIKDGSEINTAHPGDEISIITNQTPFYGESGGQQGDTGSLVIGDSLVTVTNTLKKADGLFIHIANVTNGIISKNDTAVMTVEHHRRGRLRSNHSATHLIHEGLRMVLGDHVAQKGSLVSPDRLRFDISHPKPVSVAELERVETISNQVVLQNAPVETRIMAVDDAIEAGAMALFGEKYGDEVRVVSMGNSIDADTADKSYSVELCGGTHVHHTGDIGLITILAENAVSSGVRRIEALTGDAARNHLEQQQSRLKQIAETLKVPPAQAVDRVMTLVNERKKLERELSEAKKKLAMGGGSSSSGASVKKIKASSGEINFIGRVIEDVSVKELKGLVDEGKSGLGSGIIVICVKAPDGKAGIVVGVTDDLTENFSAVDLVRVGSSVVGGKGGGGRPDMAQAGGPNGNNAQQAIDAIEAAIQA